MMDAVTTKAAVIAMRERSVRRKRSSGDIGLFLPCPGGGPQRWKRSNIIKALGKRVSVQCQKLFPHARRLHRASAVKIHLLHTWSRLAPYLTKPIQSQSLLEKARAVWEDTRTAPVVFCHTARKLCEAQGGTCSAKR